MPSPKVFVSSTCYDFGMAREQLRAFLLRLGYDPILSEYSDVVGPAEFTQSLRQTQNSAGLNRIVNDGCQFSIGIENRR